MRARSNDKCDRCGDPIHPGDHIRTWENRDRSVTLVHEGCDR